jgi:hypothetical protein
LRWRTNAAPFRLKIEARRERKQGLKGLIWVNSFILDKLRQSEYAVKFPDFSSVKIIRRANLTCANSKCALVLLPLDSLQP